MRFGRYLAEQYKNEDLVNGKKTILPITTIYILGFKLPEVVTPCLKVERNYRDLIENKVIISKSDFIEKLTHCLPRFFGDSFIVQVDRISDKYQTKLDKLLSIFEQRNFVDDTKIIKEFKHEIDTDDMKLATDILHYAGTEPEERKKIEIEQEAWRTVNAMFEDNAKELLEELAEQKKVIDEKNKALNEKDRALDEKDKALNDTQKAMSEKDKMLEEMAEQLEALKRKLGEG